MICVLHFFRKQWTFDSSEIMEIIEWHVAVGRKTTIGYSNRRSMVIANSCLERFIANPHIRNKSYKRIKQADPHSQWHFSFQIWLAPGASEIRRNFASWFEKCRGEASEDQVRQVSSLVLMQGCGRHHKAMSMYPLLLWEILCWIGHLRKFFQNFWRLEVECPNLDGNDWLVVHVYLSPMSRFHLFWVDCFDITFNLTPQNDRTFSVKYGQTD